MCRLQSLGRKSTPAARCGPVGHAGADGGTGTNGLSGPRLDFYLASFQGKPPCVDVSGQSGQSGGNGGPGSPGGTTPLNCV